MRTLLALTLLAVAPVVSAKLPEPSSEAKAKAEETAARQAWAAKVAGYQLCRVQDEVAAQYRQTAMAAGRNLPAPMATPPCTDPGAFEYKPLEQAGAHSPAATALTPPNENKPEAEARPGSD